MVTWPDGHETKGLEKHIEDLKALFVFAPDIAIKEHPIRFGSGSWTTATAVMTGTFSQPMVIGGGKSIPPTSKCFAIGMVTVGHWGEWHEGPRMALLGQRRFHEANWPRQISQYFPKLIDCGSTKKLVGPLPFVTGNQLLPNWTQYPAD